MHFAKFFICLNIQLTEIYHLLLSIDKKKIVFFILLLKNHLLSDCDTEKKMTFYFMRKEKAPTSFFFEIFMYNNLACKTFHIIIKTYIVITIFEFLMIDFQLSPQLIRL